ncbi:MAG TPA: UDP-2,3-diacylglucosamine hydrolase, partial [Rikenellaceae bacterium]|nr:UDP-2,3-diacylglucosamine hydrolase [Rikenellaceae bacterium]
RLSDRGVKLYFFRGNHDLWVFGYFEKELGMTILEQPAFIELGGKRFCLAHGDGLAGDDKKYEFLKS